MQLGKLKFSASMVRITLIYMLFGLLIILRLLPIAILRGANCVSAITESNTKCVDNSISVIAFWGITILLIFWELLANKEMKLYLYNWKKDWVILPFLFLAMISFSWSVAPVITLERSAILIFSSISAVFIVYKRDITSNLSLLSIYFALLIGLCYLLIFFYPSLGTMDFKPYNGAWRGIFWHRNYLGSFMAFASVVYSFKLFIQAKQRFYHSVLNGIGLAASIGLVFGSHSGAGIITLVLVIGLTFLLLLWTRIKTYLKKWHYIVFSFAFLVLLILVLTNLDFIFGLVGRNTSLTGRVPLWKLLFDEYINKRLFFGYGYGAFWTFEQVRVALQHELSWGYSVLIGDNGLIDIQLHLGLAGSLLMILIICYALFTSAKCAVKTKTILSFFPLIAAIFIIISNISLSMLIELEFFNWFLLILIIFLSSEIRESLTQLSN